MIKIRVFGETDDSIKLEIETNDTSSDGLKDFDKVCSALSSGENAIQFGYNASNIFRVELLQ